MALAYPVSLRNSRLDEITAVVDAGSGAALIRIYDSTRPATGAAITSEVLLAELTMSDPAFPAASSGSIVGNSVTSDASANATGTAEWFRVVDSDLNFVMDGDVGTSGSDLNITTTSITSGIEVSISQFDIASGNA